MCVGFLRPIRTRRRRVADDDGSSLSRCSFSYSKFGKAEYSTRIILQDLNPVFEETFPILLTSEEIKNEESLLLMLWDKDKHTKDDLIGRSASRCTPARLKPACTDRSERNFQFEFLSRI